MIIKNLIAKNYRTLENIEISFNGFYTAISGRNNAGKSNIIRAIRGILNHNLRFKFLNSSILGFEAFDWKNEVTSWKKDSKEDVSIDLLLEIDKNKDSAIFKFFTNMIFKESENSSILEKETLQIKLCKTAKNETKYVTGNFVCSNFRN